MVASANPLIFKGTEILLAPEFSSGQADHRSRLRARLQSNIRATGYNVTDHELATLTDLSKPPRLDGWNISVSHCPNGGGFIARPGRQSLGLDFEVASRLSNKVITRVASFENEKRLLAKFDDEKKALFWVAKESAIKAFGNHTPESPTHFGEVEITQLDLEAGTFEAHRDGLRARGNVWLQTPLADVVAAVAEIASI